MLTDIDKLQTSNHRTTDPMILMMPLAPAMASRLSPVSVSYDHAHV